MPIVRILWANVWSQIHVPQLLLKLRGNVLEDEGPDFGPLSSSLENANAQRVRLAMSQHAWESTLFSGCPKHTEFIINFNRKQQNQANRRFGPFDISIQKVPKCFRNKEWSLLCTPKPESKQGKQLPGGTHIWKRDANECMRPEGRVGLRIFCD